MRPDANMDEQITPNQDEKLKSLKEELALLEGKEGKTNKKTLISGIIFMIMMAIIVVTVILNTSEISQIADTFSSIATGQNYLWLLAAIGMTLVFFVLFPISLVILAKSFDKKSSTTDAYLIGASEHFFNGVTPFAAGGQPIQMYDFTKKGMKSGTATGLVLTNFVIYLIALNLLEVFAFFYIGDINEAIYNFTVDPATGNLTGYYWTWALAILGYVFNLGFLFFIIALGCSKRLANWLIRVAKWFCRFRWINKFLGKRIPAFEMYCENVQSTMKALFAHKGSVFVSFLFKLVSYMIYFSLPYFLLRAVGEPTPWSEYAEVGFLSAFASGAVCWIPTPGGTGGIEFAFAICLGAIGVEYARATVIALLWRMLTFYFVLILSLITVIIFESKFQAGVRMDAKTIEARKEELLAQIAELENQESPQKPN